jgi:hypothetical protein
VAKAPLRSGGQLGERQRGKFERKIDSIEKSFSVGKRKKLLQSITLAWGRGSAIEISEILEATLGEA